MQRSIGRVRAKRHEGGSRAGETEGSSYLALVQRECYTTRFMLVFATQLSMRLACGVAATILVVAQHGVCADQIDRGAKQRCAELEEARSAANSPKQDAPSDHSVPLTLSATIPTTLAPRWSEPLGHMSQWLGRGDEPATDGATLAAQGAPEGGLTPWLGDEGRPPLCRAAIRVATPAPPRAVLRLSGRVIFPTGPPAII